MYFMLLVIVYSSVLLAVESLPDVKSTDYRLWVFSDIICSVVFTVGVSNLFNRIIVSP